ncbi:hypothetical protein ACJX0J_036918, partial [Zea mays]
MTFFEKTIFGRKNANISSKNNFYFLNGIFVTAFLTGFIGSIEVYRSLEKQIVFFIEIMHCIAVAAYN